MPSPPALSTMLDEARLPCVADEFADTTQYIGDCNLFGGDWNHGILYDFPETVGNGMSSSQLTFTPSFFGLVETTNQITIIQ